MNKIVLDNNKMYYEGFQSDKVILDCKGNSSCKIKSIPKSFTLEINMYEQAHLLLDLELVLNNTEFNINIHSYSNSTLELNLAITYKEENTIHINSIVHEDNTITNIKVRCVEENGTLDLKAEGTILENTHNNEYVEDIKALTSNNNSITIKPNLKVYTNSVMASHNATISNLDEKELFYLESRGISKDMATNLIKSGFLKGILMYERGD